MEQANCRFETTVIELQLADFAGFPVPSTQFKITVLSKFDGKEVILQIPLINFQTGQISPDNDVPPILAPIIGGYLYTVDGHLPKHLRPRETVFRSYLSPADDGITPASLSVIGSVSPVISGFIIQITDAGELIIQGAGEFGNIIPAGNHILLPTNVAYLVQPRVKLAENMVISKGATNTTQFTDDSAHGALNTQLRDLHVNDAFDDIVAWAWTDNSDQADKTNNVLNVIVAVGIVTHCGIKITSRVQLTNFTPGIFAWDTAVAINRTNKKNIVVSWSVLNAPGTPNRAASFDGGKTWAINGPVFPVPIISGDNRGVAADKFGNFWYNYGDFTNEEDIPRLAISTNGGITFTNVDLGLPSLLPFAAYDYPQICFGGDGLGNYGIWVTADVLTFLFDGIADFTNVTVFLPITGLGSFGTPVSSFLNQFVNCNAIPVITASENGRLWYLTNSLITGVGFSYTAPANVIYKSPGPINQNLVGPWNVDILNLKNLFHGSQQVSQPNNPFGYLQLSAQSIIFDERRQALYTLVATPYPINNGTPQDMRLLFRISRNNGQTWSDPIAINNTDFANRGFQSMALDPVAGNLIFGWYDGRNDKTLKSVEYFTAILTCKELDQLVKDIPISDPTFVVPLTPTPDLSKAKDVKKKALPLTKRLERLKRNFGKNKP